MLKNDGKPNELACEESVVESFSNVIKEAVAEFRKPVAFCEIPAKYADILSVESLTHTMDMLEVGANEIMLVRNEGDEKPALLKRRRELETEIKLAEASAIMEDPSFVTLKNETQRDAFRRVKTTKQRTELAGVEGQLEAIDAKIQQERTDREALKLATESAQKKATLQAALLEFLGGR